MRTGANLSWCSVAFVSCASGGRSAARLQTCCGSIRSGLRVVGHGSDDFFVATLDFLLVGLGILLAEHVFDSCFAAFFVAGFPALFAAGFAAFFVAGFPPLFAAVGTY